MQGEEKQLMQGEENPMAWQGSECVRSNKGMGKVCVVSALRGQKTSCCRTRNDLSAFCFSASVLRLRLRPRG